jgi:hypothetical protein
VSVDDAAIIVRARPGGAIHNPGQTCADMAKVAVSARSSWVSSALVSSGALRNSARVMPRSGHFLRKALAPRASGHSLFFAQNYIMGCRRFDGDRNAQASDRGLPG